MTSFGSQILPYVDQTRMYSSVYKQLRDGGSIGIFPEGGSHDRTDLLPLKAGVSIMALGAMLSDPELRLRIVPVGLSYFHAHRFRSRAVVEFGNPIDVPRDAVESFEQGGDAKKKAIGQVMDLVFNGLKSVTVRAPDYETLMVRETLRSFEQSLRGGAADSSDTATLSTARSAPHSRTGR